MSREALTWSAEKAHFDYRYALLRGSGVDRQRRRFTAALGQLLDHHPAARLFGRRAVEVLKDVEAAALVERSDGDRGGAHHGCASAAAARSVG